MDNQSVYFKIFYSTGKYLVLKNIFMFVTGLFSIFIVRLLSPVEYGKWSLVWQLIATIGPIISLGFLSTLAKFIPEYTEEKRKNELFSQSLFIVIVAFLVFALLYTVGTALFPKIIPIEIKVVKYPFLFFVGAVALINLFEGYYRGLGKFNQWTIIDGGRSVLSAGLAILFILTLSKRFETVFYTYFFLIIFFLIALLFFLRKNFSLKPNFKFEPQIIKFSLTLFTGQVIYLLMSNVNPVFLRTLLRNPTELGYYFAGIRLSQIVEIAVLGQLATPFLFYFSHPQTTHLKEKVIAEGTKIMGILFGFVALVFFSFADKIVPFLFGNIYNESISVMRIYSFWIFLFSLQVFAGAFFSSINKPLILLSLGFIFILLNFSFNILFIPQLKAKGAALSSVVSIFFLDFIYFFLYEKYGIKIILKMGLILFALIVSLTAGLFVNLYLSPIVFLVIILGTKQISYEDIKKFKKII